MENHVLVNDEKHEGKYVAFSSIVDHTIVSEGDDPESVMISAREQGHESPMIVYIPNKDMRHCY
ncbi:MAG: DUF5678 domain-containing protein [Planctomycetaceae bacterium]|nr:DUF5678 domain-containing protein [Planctomycetaceae bacterium]